MPPKKDSDQTGNEAIRCLCYLLMTSKQFEPDLGQLAEYVGVKDKKNVPRKINSLVSAHGFEFKDQKIITKSSDASNGDQSATPTPRSVKTPPDDQQTPKTPTSTKKKTPRTPKVKSETKAKTPASKKRKMDDIEENGHDVGEIKDEVHDMIMAAMGEGNEAEATDLNGGMEEA